jgi:hypothetical protein
MRARSHPGGAGDGARPLHSDPCAGSGSRVVERLRRGAVAIERAAPDRLLFQHTVFCQIALPYRDPGLGTRRWLRRQGQVACLIEAGHVLDPRTGAWLELGLPYGPKPRLILTHLNAEALRTGSPEIDVERSLTAFVRRLGLASKGLNIRRVRDQLARLAAAQVRLALAIDDAHASQLNAHIVGGLELWLFDDRGRRRPWPKTVRLSPGYFASLRAHAIPLDERAIAALSHSAMALDVYAWLAQRLHRIDPRRPQLVSWEALHDQFGAGYRRERKFREVFRHTLERVVSQYATARVACTANGLVLYASKPPVRDRPGILP